MTDAEATAVTTTATTIETVTEKTVSVEATVTKEETLVEEEAGYKVFVGNLSFQTSEEELADFFGSVGKVLKANIITRGTRSLGYGFVALETEEESKKAVAELNKQDLGGRQINVEVAKPKNESTSNYATDAQQNNTSGARRGRGRGRGGWGSRRRFSSRNSHNINNNNNEDGGEAAENNDSTAVTASDAPNTNGTNAEENITGKPHRGGYRRRGGRGRGRGRGRFQSRRRSQHNSNQAAGAAKTGDPSKTVVFVANLPFSIDDEGLKEIFKDYNVTSAHVVQRRGGRSKGFGFVELADEEEQKRALEGLKGVKSEERELVIKIALSDQHAQQVGVSEEKPSSGVAEESATTEENKEPVTTGE